MSGNTEIKWWPDTGLLIRIVLLFETFLTMYPFLPMPVIMKPTKWTHRVPILLVKCKVLFKVKTYFFLLLDLFKIEWFWVFGCICLSFITPKFTIGTFWSCRILDARRSSRFYCLWICYPGSGCIALYLAFLGIFLLKGLKVFLHIIYNNLPYI